MSTKEITICDGCGTTLVGEAIPIEQIASYKVRHWLSAYFVIGKYHLCKECYLIVHNLELTNVLKHIRDEF